MAKNDDLSFPVLVCVATAPAGRHGYAIVSTLRERLHLSVPFPSVYRALKRLARRGLVDMRVAAPGESLAGVARKVCVINRAGRVEVRQLEAAHKHRVAQTNVILWYLWENWHETPDGQTAA